MNNCLAFEHPLVQLDKVLRKMRHNGLLLVPYLKQRSEKPVRGRNAAHFKSIRKPNYWLAHVLEFFEKNET
jgi:hypothetical protein